MTLLDVIVLGLVQGLTEFIPVSSSGHLVISHALLGTNGNFEFDVLLNIGTLAALLWYFRVKLKNIVLDIWHAHDVKLIGLLVMATIPAFAVGFFLNDWLEQQNAKLTLVIANLAVVGMLMILFGRQRKNARTELDEVRSLDAITIGTAQVFALLPGMSRSGVTMLAGLGRGLSAKLAAEFSFLLAIPTISGAIAYTLLDGASRDFIAAEPILFAIGNLASFSAGVWAIGFLLRLVSQRGLRDFGYYRVGLAAVLAILLYLDIV